MTVSGFSDVWGSLSVVFLGAAESVGPEVFSLGSGLSLRGTRNDGGLVAFCGNRGPAVFLVVAIAAGRRSYGYAENLIF